MSKITCAFVWKNLMLARPRMRHGAAIGLSLLIACALAEAASVSHALAASSPRNLLFPPNDPVLRAQREAMGGDMINDMPFGVDIEGMTSGKGMYGGNYGPSIMADELELLIKLLCFSAEQAATARQLYQQRQANYFATAGPLQAAANEIFESTTRMHHGGREPDQDIFTPFTLAAKRVESERIIIRMGVLEDLRSLLTPEQEPNWPKMEAAARLVRFMRLESVVNASGVRVDVRSLVERTLMERTLAQAGTGAPSLSNREAIDDLLKEYGLASDAIVRRACSLDDEIRAHAERAQATRESWTARAELGTELLEKIEQFRNANETVMRKVTGIISGATADKLWLLYHRESFPKIYGRLHSERVLEAALKLSDLSAQQREELMALQASHLTKLATLRTQVAGQQVEEQQLTMQVRKIENEEARKNIMTRLRELRLEVSKTELKNSDYAMVKDVRGIVTEAQRAKLPKRAKPVMPAIETSQDEAWRETGH